MGPLTVSYARASGAAMMAWHGGSYFTATDAERTKNNLIVKPLDVVSLQKPRGERRGPFAAVAYSLFACRVLMSPATH